jgi:hypothetical protein
MFIRINIFRWWQNLHVLRTPRRQTCAPARDRDLRHRSCQPLILSLGIIQQPRIFTEIRPWSNPDFQIPTNCSGFVRMFTSQMSPIATVWRCNPQTRHLQEAKTGFGKHFEPSRSIITNKQLTILGNNWPCMYKLCTMTSKITRIFCTWSSSICDPSCTCCLHSLLVGKQQASHAAVASCPGPSRTKWSAIQTLSISFGCKLTWATESAFRFWESVHSKRISLGLTELEESLLQNDKNMKWLVS